MRAPTWAVLPIAVMVLLTGGPVAGQEPVQRTASGLIYDLQHPEASRRTEAARLLGQNKVHAAVPALIDASADSDEAVRLEVVEALVRIHDRRALPTYVTLTRGASAAIQEKAIEGIINIYVGDESGFIHGLTNVIDFVNPFSDDYDPLVVEPFTIVDQNAVEAIADLLLSDGRDIRQHAATALGILRARSALPAIQDALEHEPLDAIKVELIRAIYKIGDRAAGSALVPRMLDSDKDVHDEAIFAAGRLKVAEAVPHLIDMLNTGVEERRRILGFVPVSGRDDLTRRVLDALAYIGDSRADAIFLERLDADAGWSRRFAAEGLARIGDSVHLPAVRQRHDAEEARLVKLALGYARYRLGEVRYLADLVDRVNDSDQAYSYLLELSPSEVSDLFPYLQAEGDEVKIRLLEIVGMRGDRSALVVAEQMIQTGTPDVQSAANLAILRIRGRYPGA